jgi:hypothetical protein
MPDSSFGGLHIADDVASADWIVASVRNFHHDVGSLLPVSFEAYARVLHPARRQSGIGEVDVPWSVVAHANGRIAHAAMEWVAITGDWKFMNDGVAGGQPGIWDRSPSTGRLPASQAASLASILARFTNAPLECRFAVWDGYADAPYQRGTVALIDMPNRPMVLLDGWLAGKREPLVARRTSVVCRVRHRPHEHLRRGQR